MYTVNSLPSAGAGPVIVVGSGVGYYFGFLAMWIGVCLTLAIILASITFYRKVKGV